jgi:hypothetical protein
VRPPTQGPEAVQSDIIHLNRVLRRIQCDTKRSKPLKEKLEEHLKNVISILLLEDRATPSSGFASRVRVGGKK